MGGVGCTLYELKAMSWDIFWESVCVWTCLVGGCGCIDIFFG